ncbi:MAG: phosphotransferase [Bacteroidota bacterium]
MNSRNTIFWIGRTPAQNVMLEFQCRDIKLDYLTVKTNISQTLTDQSLIKSLGVIYFHKSIKLGNTITFLRIVSTPLVKYSGIKILIIVEDTSEVNRIKQTFLGKSDFSTFNESHISFQLKQSIEYNDVARSFSQLQSNPYPNINLKIYPRTGTILSEEQNVLLRRSFSDCDSLHIHQLDQQGYSAKVFSVYPQINDGISSGRLQPFLVKFDKIDDIINENNYYKTYVNPYIPFSLRPNLDHNRSIHSSEISIKSDEFGALVSSYVDRAIPLLEAIEKGTGPNALHCLFEESLDRWLQNTKIEDGSPFDAIEKRFKQNKFNESPQILTEAKKIGHVLDPDVLLAKLKTIPCNKHRNGIIHGDLHANNILVKGYDAIIIDFSECRNGPVLVDLATLDVSIAFFSALRIEKEEEFKEWIRFVKEKYSYKNVSGLPVVRQGYEYYMRQWNCIRQIRRHALMERVDKMEYAICLANELLKHSVYINKSNFGLQIAAYSYYLSSNLAQEILTNT